MKTCSKCKELKSREDFYKLSKSPDGLKVWCKICCYEYEKQHRLNNKFWMNERYRNYYKTHNGKEKNRLRMREWIKNNKEYHLEQAKIYCSKRRARKKNLKENFGLKKRKFIKELFLNRCFNCGSEYKLEIDHHYPLSKGYVLKMGNAVLLCETCNYSKGAKMPEVFYNKEKLNELKSIFKVLKYEENLV